MTQSTDKPAIPERWRGGYEHATGSERRIIDELAAAEAALSEARERIKWFEEHNQHFRNPDTGQIECRCCDKQELEQKLTAYKQNLDLQIEVTNNLRLDLQRAEAALSEAQNEVSRAGKIWVGRCSQLQQQLSEAQRKLADEEKRWIDARYWNEKYEQVCHKYSDCKQQVTQQAATISTLMEALEKISDCKVTHSPGVVTYTSRVTILVREALANVHTGEPKL